MQSKLNKITACLALGCFAIGVANAQTGNPAYDAWAKASGPKPGLFEYKMTTEMSGMPGMGTMKMPTKTMRHCVTQKDIDEGRQFMTGQKDTGFKCTITDFSKQGNIVKYTQSCSEKWPHSSEQNSPIFKWKARTNCIKCRTDLLRISTGCTDLILSCL